MPVPAGMTRPTMTFSLRPRRPSTLPLIAASVSTRVVSWKLAAEMKLSVDSDALVMPRSSGRPMAGVPPRGDDALVLFAELPAVHLLVDQELGVADLLDLHRPHHLAHDHLDVLVVDRDALRPVDLLDLVGHVALQLLLAEHLQDVVRVDRAVDQRIAGAHPLALLHVDVDRARHQVLAGVAHVALDDHLAHALVDLAQADRCRRSR